MSPYISRGVISTREVYEYIRTLNTTWKDSEKLIQELAWRDYWQQVWVAKGKAIDGDLNHTQKPIFSYQIPEAVINGKTGIDAIDGAIQELYETGYMHNHMRMYVASICCNFGHVHWFEPAKWLYAHLLDGDIASNQLSWQWIAGSFSGKKYYMNQENINKFFQNTQKNTFLDVDYDYISNIPIPAVLEKSIPFTLKTQLPNLDIPDLKHNKITLVYNYYNLDPFWYPREDVQRVLLLEPSIFRQRPVSQKCIDFILNLSDNIPDVKLFVGEFKELLDHLDSEQVIYKEHPLNHNYRGREEPREWISSIKGYFPSFFAFWKKCKKELVW